MNALGRVPDVLGLPLNDAVRIATEVGFATRVVQTLPPKQQSPGVLRVVRQTLVEDENILEILVAPEDWGHR